jgi:hypothetical protein
MFYRSNQTAKRYQAEFKDVVKRYNIGHVVHIGSTDLLSLGEGDIEAGLKEAKAAGADFALLILKKKNTPAYSACKDRPAVRLPLIISYRRCQLGND